MRNVLASIVVATMLAACSDTVSSSEASRPENLASNPVKGISVVDRKAREQLGVGIMAIGMLMRSGDKVFLLEEALSPVEREAVNELVAAGYVNKANIPAKEGMLINLSWTAKGREVVSAINGGG